MKKTISKVGFGLLLCFAIFSTASAQNAFKKSDKILEGTVSYSKASGSDATYGLNPSFGYFLTDKTAVGVYLGFGKDGGDETSAIGAFGRYYMLSVGQNLKAYTQMTVGNSSVKAEGEKVSTFGIGAGIGVNYFVSPKIALALDVANLMSYTSQGSNTEFSIGWEGVTNPLNASNFGVLFRF